VRAVAGCFFAEHGFDGGTHRVEAEKTAFELEADGFGAFALEIPATGAEVRAHDLAEVSARGRSEQLQEFLARRFARFDQIVVEDRQRLGCEIEHDSEGGLHEAHTRGGQVGDGERGGFVVMFCHGRSIRVRASLTSTAIRPISRLVCGIMGALSEVGMGSDQRDRRGVGSALTENSPYLGALGRTRTETAQVWMPDGKIRALSVYTGVDATSDPALAGIACAGTLHQLGHGVTLAIAFTYHDPLQRIFLIVVPEGLRHRALALRAEHMALIAADVEHAVPDYVRDCEVVIGPEGLTARLESGTPVPALRGVDSAVADERMVALRERELAIERRERLLSAREQASQRRGSLAVLDSELEEVSDDEPLLGEAVLAEGLEGDEGDEGDDSELVGDDTELEDVEGDEIEDVDDAEALDDSDETSEADDAQREPRATPAIPGTFRREDRVSAPDGAFADGTTPLPPASFVHGESGQLGLIESAGEVWLFVRGCPESARNSEELDLLVQLDPALEEPVLVLSLVFDVDDAPRVLHGVVDTEDPEQARALEALAHRFTVQLVSLDDEGKLEHWATLRGPREANVSAVLSFLAELSQSRVAWLTGRERALASPPVWRDLEHPFQIWRAEEHAVSATEAAVLLDELVEWLSPDRRMRLILLLSVPVEVIEMHYRVGICDALDWGLALPQVLRPLASELGIVSDEASLLTRRIQGLCRTSRAEDLGGLEAGVLRALWSEAVDRALVVGVELSAEAEELLRVHVGDRALVHAEGLAEASDATLMPLRAALHQFPLDLVTLSELAARGGHRDLLDLGAVTTRLSPSEATDLFVRMVVRKDAAASDALRGLLASAEDARVRACAALSLAALRVVDAIDDLCHRLRVTEAPDWRLYALCLGRYGVGSFRAIQRALEAEQVDDERIAHVYAHLALHGARAQIRARGRSSDERESRIADRAIALAGEMKDANTPAQGLEKQGDLTVFCEMFDRSLRALSA